MKDDMSFESGKDAVIHWSLVAGFVVGLILVYVDANRVVISWLRYMLIISGLLAAGLLAFREHILNAANTEINRSTLIRMLAHSIAGLFFVGLLALSISTGLVVVCSYIFRR